VFPGSTIEKADIIYGIKGSGQEVAVGLHEFGFRGEADKDIPKDRAGNEQYHDDNSTIIGPFIFVWSGHRAS
jgi:hypothetical protein